MTTSHPLVSRTTWWDYTINREIKIGDYRPLDPTREPFGIKAITIFQWKVKKYDIRAWLSKYNLAYGIDSEWTKRTYLHVRS